ncbi:UNVERIFIED_CONTAM: hypothetical protein Scaly_2767100 [Sesamum calycinum]|uniref:Integrase catalytic domain-containing protein n=1 Tax=Sesamum calycinum TaxID=2727403 RepID=A0AAW2IYQ1_9LAMI
MPAEWELSDDVPDEDVLVIEVTPPWRMYFNGASHKEGTGAGVVFVTSEGEVQAMEEAHSGIFGGHQSGPKLHFCTKRMGHYWPTLVKDYINYVRRCQACQFHANLIHQPPESLHPTVASWPFNAWGLDVVGPLTKSSRGHLYILTAIDYFSKWVEAVPLKELKKEKVADFIRTHIIYRYGVPRYTLSLITESPFAIA